MIFVLTINLPFAQTVHRVNNNPGLTASAGAKFYTSFAAAHTAAVANDIIIIEPSNTSYGNITITKPLKIYGSGYYLTTNTELKVDQRTTVIENIDFNTGSGGSEIYGVQANQVSIYGVSNIKISRCLVTYSGVGIVNTNIAGTTNTNVTNIVINQSVISGSPSGNVSIRINPTNTYTISGVLINNNIIGAHGITANSDPGVQSLVIRNNTFTTTAIATIVNAVFENNLLAVSGAVVFSNVTYSYNVSTGASFPSESNFNRNNYVIAPINDAGQAESQLLGTGTGISPDEQYQIKAGSDLKTLGNGGTEVGAYGGSTPYIVSGIPPIPSITNMINTGSGDNSNPLKVTISVKSNN